MYLGLSQMAHRHPSRLYTAFLISLFSLALIMYRTSFLPGLFAGHLPWSTRGQGRILTLLDLTGSKSGEAFTLAPCDTMGERRTGTGTISSTLRQGRIPYHVAGRLCRADLQRSQAHVHLLRPHPL